MGHSSILLFVRTVRLMQNFLSSNPFLSFFFFIFFGGGISSNPFLSDFISSFCAQNGAGRRMWVYTGMSI